MSLVLIWQDTDKRNNGTLAIGKPGFRLEIIDGKLVGSITLWTSHFIKVDCDLILIWPDTIIPILTLRGSKDLRYSMADMDIVKIYTGCPVLHGVQGGRCFHGNSMYCFNLIHFRKRYKQYILFISLSEMN